MRSILLAAACIMLFTAAMVGGPGAARADCAAIQSACFDHCRSSETNAGRVSACANRCSITFCQDIPTTCRPGDQRVCNDDFRSCNGACAALAAIPSAAATANATACSSRCCTGFKACLNQRSCDTSGLDCR
jgi:hypothetical protein